MKENSNKKQEFTGHIICCPAAVQTLNYGTNLLLYLFAVQNNQMVEDKFRIQVVK